MAQAKAGVVVGRALNEYGLWKTWVAQGEGCLSEEVKELSDELAKLKNGSNLVR